MLSDGFGHFHFQLHPLNLLFPFIFQKKKMKKKLCFYLRSQKKKEKSTDFFIHVIVKSIVFFVFAPEKPAGLSTILHKQSRFIGLTKRFAVI